MTPLAFQFENPHSRIRADGRRGWYHPSRLGGLGVVRVIVVHTTESDPRAGGASSVGTWQARSATVPSSYHRIVDASETALVLPDAAVAFHVRGYNTSTLGLSFATRARLWGTDQEWDARALARGAREAAAWCRTYDIPPVLLTRAQVDAGRAGFTSHAALDPDRRSDPGSGFPWDRFLAAVAAVLNPTPAAPPPPPDPWELMMADLTDTEKDQLLGLARELERQQTNGASFVRQLLTFHREERPRLRELLDAIAETASTPRGVGLWAPRVIRAARSHGWDLDRFHENRDYTAEEQA